LAEAEPVLVDAKDRIEAIHGLDDRATASAYLEVGRLRAAQGRAVEARTWLERALAIRRATYGDRHARVADVERALAEL
jgi:hypothetical protein